VFNWLKSTANGGKSLTLSAFGQAFSLETNEQNSY